MKRRLVAQLMFWLLNHRLVTLHIIFSTSEILSLKHDFEVEPSGTFKNRAFLTICFQVRFGQEWVEQNIPNAKSVRTGKWQAKWETNADRMRAAYDRCGTKPESRKRRQIERFEDWTVSDDDLFASTERSVL